MKRGVLLTVFLVIGLWAGLTSLAGASPQAGQIYFGLGVGEAALNNDLYIYSFEATARQPEMAPHHTRRQDGPAFSVYAGRVLAAKETNFLGGSTFNVGLQAGYTDLGEYTIEVEYANDPLPGVDGYRKVDEDAVDLLLTSTLYWESGLNLFAKAGVTRLRGRYEQAGLRSPRQPEYNPPKEAYTYVAYRPEIAIGVGYLISDKVSVSAQYTAILGPQPDTTGNRFSDSYMVELPNTLYKADSLTIGATFYW